MLSVIRRALDMLRHARRALKARLPYVRRREYRILRRRHDALIDALTVDARAATDAKIHALKPLPADLAGEICLFVTHAREPQLKPHVVAHARALQQAGFHVVLMVNTDLALDKITVDTALLPSLAGCYARCNEGFDFAAWGHAYALGNGFPNCDRLLLVNDSVIGPINAQHFDGLISRLRETPGDVVGLTENSLPHRHLQSYFRNLTNSRDMPIVGFVSPL